MKIIILCGGSGTRLWPLSREEFPKQFIRLFSNKSFFQETVKRSLNFVGEEDIFVVTGEKYEWLVRDELEKLGVNRIRIVTEPVARNTAPAIALGVKKLMSLEVPPLEDILVLPSDHLIKDIHAFLEAVRRGFKLTERGFLVLFGEKPTYPETGYGYIKLGKILEENLYTVEDFEEKPPKEKAEKFVKSDKYLWNCGIFLFKLERVVKDFTELIPEIDLNKPYEDFLERFKEYPNISFDQGILERTTAKAVVSVKMGWSDVGSFKAVYENLPKDAEGNVIFGEVKSLGGKNNLFISTGKSLVTSVNLRDTVVVNTEDAVLVVNKEDVQQVKELFSLLKKEGNPKALKGKTHHVPYGVYVDLEEGERYRVRKLILRVGKKIPLKLHHHRTQHWIVLRGTAKIVVGKEEKFLHENESFFVPKSIPYSIENVGKIPLELIEVQSGEYLMEDDQIELEKN